MNPLVSGVIRVVSANLEGSHDQPLTVASMLVASSAHVLVVHAWDGENLDLETLEAAGYQGIAGGPDRGEIGIFALGEGVGAVIEGLVDGPCDLPWVAARIELDGLGGIAVLAIPAPPGQCTASTLETLAARFRSGLPAVDIGPLRPGEELLVVGDLNSGGRSGRFERLIVDSGLRDAPRDGHTASATWPSAIPLRRIDHLLISPGWEAYTTWVLPIPGSNHRAVLADLRP